VTTTLTGPAGTAALVDLTGIDDARSQATLAWWLFTCPGQSPAWDQYAMWCITLAPVVGLDDAVIDVLGATHQLIVVALDPHTTWTAEQCGELARTDGGIAMLRPGNVSLQFAAASDDQATELAHLCARAVVDGLLPAEPMLAGGGNAQWHPVVAQTLQHLQTGGHTDVP
jgi:hypothetical protein